MFENKKKVRSKIFIGLFIAVLLSQYAYAQHFKGDVRQIRKLVREGGKKVRQEKHHQALRFYEQVLALDSNNVRALLYAGICYLNLEASPKSLDYLLKAYRLNPQIEPFIHFLLGRAYHVNFQFEPALQHYGQYRQQLGNRSVADRKEVDRLISQVHVARKYYSAPSDHYTENLGVGVNSPYSDHSAILTNDRRAMVFTSTRPDNAEGVISPGKEGSFEQVYEASRFFDGSWDKPQALPINQKGQHTSNSQFIGGGQKLLLYSSAKMGSVLVTEKKGSIWTKPTSYSKYTNTQEYESNGCVAKNGKTMYFASTRGSRRGDLDLFFCRLNPDSTWSEPIPMPAYVNSEEDEDAPFLSENGLTLYFSSKGHQSMGGFDIFKTTFNPQAGLWSKPVNVGYPINSPNDDIGYFTNDSTHVSFITSNRSGSFGEEDIYDVKPLEEVNIRGIVADASDKPLAGYDVVLASVKDREVGAVTTSGPNGVYGAKVRCRHRYQVSVLKDGEVVRTEELDIPLTSRENVLVIKDFQLPTGPTNTPKPIRQLRIDNLNLVKISYQEFDSLIIRGSVANEASPLIGAQVRLRREVDSTFERVTTTDANGGYQLAWIPGARRNYVLEITQPGYPAHHVALVYVERDFNKPDDALTRRKNVNRVVLNARLQKPELYTSFVLGGLYFESKNAGWKPANTYALDQLASWLQEDPTLKIEIGGYTDNANGVGENRVVSQRWAYQVLSYLVEKGVAKSRMTAKGYGESKPVAPNNTELNGRDVNRRIEIKVIGKEPIKIPAANLQSNTK